jgi:hypothetical protein
MPSGRPLDVRGRIDGLYGVFGEQVGELPLFGFDGITLVSEGVDAKSGKRWLRFRLGAAEARRLQDFTRSPSTRGVTVVVGGEAACSHKIREPVQSDLLQLSCCNPRACDRRALVLDRR